MEAASMPVVLSATPAVHVREHRSLLAAAEKQLLIWIARHLPRWVTSDHLSLIGLGSMIAAGACLVLHTASPWASAGAVLSLALNWFGDSLDGTVARVRGQERPRFGYYVDHVIDLAGTACLMGGLALSGLMSPTLALLVLLGYVLVCAESYLATHAVGVFRMSFVGFGPTELRIILAIGLMKAAASPWVDVPWFGSARLFDAGGIVAAAGLLVAFLVSSIRNARALHAAEPLVRSMRTR
jgi:archaetidylinositol phosphate synthase